MCFRLASSLLCNKPVQKNQCSFKNLALGNCRHWASSIRIWCQIFFLLFIRPNLFPVLGYCPASASSFSFLSLGSFLQGGEEMQTWRSLSCPQERGCKENSSLSTSLCLCFCAVWTLDHKASGRSSRKGLPDHVLLLLVHLLCSLLCLFTSKQRQCLTFNLTRGTVVSILILFNQLRKSIDNILLLNENVIRQ